uniref:Acetyl-CoA carboxylase carboxyltransferase beta subunit n=1 Tax=Pelargonium cotyledonis TaxID=28968 RepID=A0A0N7ABY3_9ROSI|nr:acetyl-CoA carboxylase carboxyltransferase beta subunit [Pelargonium cotyledonis]AJA38465.1 acetyl-CoA carboxylase carboxyltransferase beta subunit [Pelargonium cotyledonis]
MEDLGLEKYKEEQEALENVDVEEDDPYQDRIFDYTKDTGLPEAIQTGKGQLNAIPLVFGAMEFWFMGGSMGSVVGERIARLVETASNAVLPLILVCASGGARMQEGSYSLMQMAKISGTLHYFRKEANKTLKLLYLALLASPTTGGVVASFGMLGDLIIGEPNATIAFAGKIVIEETLKVLVPEGSQEAEPLFEAGVLDKIVPRTLLKGVFTHLFELHAFFPLNQNAMNNQVFT